MAFETTSWFYESANSRNSNVVETPSSFAPAVICDEDGTPVEGFNERFDSLCEDYKIKGIDIKRDIARMIGDPVFMNEYKESLMAPVVESYSKACPNDPHVNSVVRETNKFWDNKVRLYNESATMTGYLPIATLEFPVLVKQFFSSILKDIIEVESVKTSMIEKHVRTTYMVDNNTGDEYEYPKCMFDGTWERLFDASKGFKIRDDIVPLTNGRLWKYDIIGGLTDGTPGVDRLSIQLRISGVVVGGEKIMLQGNGITIEFHTNGTLVNGDLNFEHNGTHIEDTIAGQVDFLNGTVSLASTNGQVEGVVFEGYLSNEKNLRHLSVREKRSLMKFQIEDGPRWNMPFSIEEIEDAAALLDMNYYQRMVDEITRTQEMQECMTVIKFLLNEHSKYKDIETDLFNLGALSRTYEVDLMPPQYFSGDPFKYVSNVLQFRLKGAIHQVAEEMKLEGISYIIVGNPMACQLLAPFAEWKYEQGTSIGGINTNGAYGFATQLGANVRVVASNLYDAYTVDPVEKTGKRELVLHIYGYPTSPDHISCRHLKYTSHLFTSQSQTAYQSTNAPGGAYNIVTATSRFKTMSVQPICVDLVLLNSDRVYGEAFKRPPVVGAPWN